MYTLGRVSNFHQHITPSLIRASSLPCIFKTVCIGIGCNDPSLLSRAAVVVTVILTELEKIGRCMGSEGRGGGGNAPLHTGVASGN